jgi:hypothetical protein
MHTAILQVINQLEHVGNLIFTHLNFCDIRRAFNFVPKWLQRLAWAHLGLHVEDLEWFFNLDSCGNIRTLFQQAHITRTTDIASGEMLGSPGNFFYPAHGGLVRGIPL